MEMLALKKLLFWVSSVAGFVFLVVVQTLFLTNDPNTTIAKMSANGSSTSAISVNVTGNATVNQTKTWQSYSKISVERAFAYIFRQNLSPKFLSKTERKLAN